jgi:hypothetical protein
VQKITVIAHNKLFLSWEWWHTPAVPAFGRLRQENHEFKASWDTYSKKQNNPVFIDSLIRPPSFMLKKRIGNQD